MLWDSRLKLPRPNASFSKTLIALLHACLLSAVCTSATVAQSPTTGRIAGTLKDPNGARIVGAQVTITSNATAEQRRVTSDDQGNYSAPLLTPGTYDVRIVASGFAPALFARVPVIITETTTANAEMVPAGPDTVSTRLMSTFEMTSSMLTIRFSKQPG